MTQEKRTRLWTALSVILGACGTPAPGGATTDMATGSTTASPGTGAAASSSDSGPGDSDGDSTTGTASSDQPTDGASDESSGTTDGVGCDTPGSLSANEQMLVDMPADSWMTAPSSDLMTTCGPVAEEFEGIRLVVGCSAIVSAWGGGTWDPVHRKMLVFGGGHNDYGGNEVYGFDTASFAWERLSDPSPPPFDIDPLADGNPVSRHTYGGIQWLEDAMFTIGGSIAIGGGPTSVPWLFDVDDGTWTQPQLSRDAPGGAAQSSGYDPTTQSVIVRARRSLHSYDVNADSWTTVLGFGIAPLWPDFERGGPKTGVVDPTRGLFWSFGSDDHLVYDIASQQMVHTQWVTTGGGVYDNSEELANYPDQWYMTGGGDIIRANAPGVDYDVQADALVAWSGGAPYALNLRTKEWTVMSPDGAPAEPTVNGTYGRWRYASAYNVFILVNTAEDDVYFYKHTAGCRQ